MTGMRVHRRRPLLCAAALLAALLLVLAPQSALADDPPPITVPTPAVPAPTPDTAPKRAPSPTPRYSPPATRSYAPPQYTPTPSRPVFSQPLSTAIRKAVTSRPKRTARPSKHRVVPIVPIRTKSAPTYARARFRPAASNRAPVRVRQRLVRSGNQSDVLAWIVPLALILAVGTALVIPARSRRARTYLPRLVAYRVPPHVHLRRLGQSVAAARERVAKLLPDVGAANAQRLIPQGVSGRIEARLHRQALAEFVAAPVPLPAVASLEPVASLEALPEPELAPLILSTPPSRR